MRGGLSMRTGVVGEVIVAGEEGPEDLCATDDACWEVCTCICMDGERGLAAASTVSEDVGRDPLLMSSLDGKAEAAGAILDGRRRWLLDVLACCRLA